MLYKVFKKYAKGGEIPVAEFNDLRDAKIYIEEKIEEDNRLRVLVTYLLKEGFDVVEEFKSGDASGSSTGSSGQSDAGGQQRGSGASFRPTPFNASPRPQGLPHNWVKDEDDNKDKE